MKKMSIYTKKMFKYVINIEKGKFYVIIKINYLAAW